MARTQTFSNGELGLSIRNKLNSVNDWTGSYSYNISDITYYNSNVYASLIDNNIGNIPTDINYWKNISTSSSYATTSSFSIGSIYSVTSSLSNYSITSSYAYSASQAEIAYNGIINNQIVYFSPSASTYSSKSSIGYFDDGNGEDFSIQSNDITKFRITGQTGTIFINNSNGIGIASFGDDNISLYSGHSLISSSGEFIGTSSFSVSSSYAPTITNGFTGTRSFDDASNLRTNEVLILNGIITEWNQYPY